MHTQSSDLEWAAVQLEDVYVLLDSLQLQEIAATVRDAREMLASLNLAIHEKPVVDGILARS
jgi:hypothetical protein